MTVTSIARPQQSMVLDSQIPDKILGLLKTHKGYIAGGALTSVFMRRDINDFDIYFNTPEDLANFIKSIRFDNLYKMKVTPENIGLMYSASVKKIFCTYETPNAISFVYMKKKFQIIKRFTGTPDVVFENFDFSINMCAWYPGTNSINGTFIFMPDFFEHLAQRRLMINVKTFYPISTVVRVFKYIRKGFTVGGVEILKIMLRVHNLDLTNFAVLKEQLDGIDTLFLKPLTDYLSKAEHAEEKYSFEEFLKIYDNLIINVLEDEQSEP